MGDQKGDRDAISAGVKEENDGAWFSLANFGLTQNKGIIAKMVTHRNAKAYKMDHEQRGSALIFSHERFNNEELASRPESNVDCSNLERVLLHLGFAVTVHKDLNYAEVTRVIAAAAAEDHEKRDCILVALLTHGDHDLVYAWDEKYKLEAIWTAFTAEKCPTLAGKPKLFFVQTCGRKRRNLGMQSLKRHETDSNSHSNYSIPTYADFLVSSCMIPDYCACNSLVLGSCFMQSLCLELEANGGNLSILSLLSFVAQRVNNCPNNDGQQQTICTFSTLTRVLCFSDWFMS